MHRCRIDHISIMVHCKNASLQTTTSIISRKGANHFQQKQTLQMQNECQHNVVKSNPLISSPLPWTATSLGSKPWLDLLWDSWAHIRHENRSQHGNVVEIINQPNWTLWKSHSEKVWGFFTGIFAQKVKLYHIIQKEADKHFYLYQVSKSV